jgi:hypothetical protein
MPIPSEVAERRRLQVISSLAAISAPEALQVAHEFFRDGGRLNLGKMAALAFRDYCHHIINDKIVLPEGKYEPHAMYFRTWMMRRLREMEVHVSYPRYLYNPATGETQMLEEY